MKRIKKQDILPAVHDILAKRHGALTPITGQGVAKGGRVEFVAEGKRVRCIIKASSGGRVSFGRKDGAWSSGLDESDFVVIVAPKVLDGDDLWVSMFDRSTIKERFEANHKSQEKAGMGELPNWIAPFHEPGRGARGVGDGFADKALWSEPLFLGSSVPAVAPSRPKRPLTIQEAKRQLSQSLGVPEDAIEIIVRA